LKYVIRGNSSAGIGCVEGIRSVDPDGSVALISDENSHTYSRPLISYLLEGKTSEKRMLYRSESFYAENSVEAYLGRSAVDIDTKNKAVGLDGGERLNYDKLLVATGSSAFVPPIDGLDTVKNRFTFVTLDDARKLVKTVKEGFRVLILGGGLIGLKCAEGLHAMGCGVTIVDMAKNVLPSILTGEAALIVEKHVSQKNVTLILSNTVTRFDKNVAYLSGGGVLEFDALVVAVGVRPNVSLVRDAGGNTGRGVIINERCETSLPDVYAAGDCTESFDISSGQTKIMALLPNAYMQGECAGINMAGGEKRFDNAIPMNSMGIFGLHMMTAGTYEGEIYAYNAANNYKRLYYKDNTLKGYIIIGDVARAGIYTSLIREKTPLDTIDFDLVKNRPQLMAFSRMERQKKLGGART
jgi:NAD(P)H-nitrite reductase large subunit